MLEAWDRTADAASRGGVLFLEWLRRWSASGPGGARFAWYEGAPFATPWSERAPADTPDGIADAPAAVRLLEEAARAVRSEYGALDVPWGSVHRARVGSHDVAVSGFGNRQVLYERFFFGPQNIMASIYYDLYPRDEMMARVNTLLHDM